MINKDGIELIKRTEGVRLKAYKCPAGKWTIGYGHTKGVTEGMTITQKQAEEFLQEDLATFENGVLKLVAPQQLTENQKASLVSFAYNVGLGNFQKSTLLKKVKADPSDPSIYDEFMKWVNGGGKKLAGLVMRREAEAALYFRGVSKKKSVGG